MGLKKYIRSFAFALSGIGYAFRSQCNMRFHIIAAVLVVIFSFFFRIDATEWCIILLCISSVFAAELINTSIEVHVDLTTPGRNEKAGHAKDLGAAAVLVVCLTSAIIGLVVFTPKILTYF